MILGIDSTGQRAQPCQLIALRRCDAVPRHQVGCTVAIPEKVMEFLLVQSASTGERNVVTTERRSRLRTAVDFLCTNSEILL